MERAEQARARMIELFPEGFEEIDRAHGIELVAYTDPSGEERMWRAFGGARADDVTDGWEERWREFHKPVRVGDLWVGQPWQDAPADSIPIVIDPGRAFGTGAHPTTRLVLMLLGNLRRGSLMDVGCGSGVVSIAAAKLGFAPVHAIDSDGPAVAAARANAAANGVAVVVERADATAVELEYADVVVANVTRALVEAIAPRVHCRSFIASGYLVADPPELPGYEHVRRGSEAGWAADLFASK